MDEMKKRNNRKEFVTQFAASNGYPVWNKVLMGTSQKQYANASLSGNSLDGVTDTTILIPFVMEGDFSVKGFIKATLNDSVSLSYSLAKDYKAYEEKLDNSKTASSAFAMLSMVLNKIVFNEDTYKITNPKLFSTDTIHKGTTKIKIDEINFSITDSAGLKQASYCIAHTTSTYYCGTPEAPTCNDEDGCDAGACPSGVCFLIADVTTTTCYNMELPDFPGGGGGGGDNGGGGEIPYVYPCQGTQNNPSPFTTTNNVVDTSDCPVPGEGDGWVSWESSISTFYESLTITQKDWWNNGGLIRDEFVNFLTANNFEYSAEYLVKDLINWLIQNNNITLSELQYYLMLPEPGDGVYDAGYWENPSTIFQQIALPTLQQFIQFFPHKSIAGGITYMPSQEVYQLVGGPLGSKYNQPNYTNACAIRPSWSFNNIQVGNSYPHRIAASSATEYGENNLSYIVNAKSFNTYMNKRYGNPNHSITAIQINGNRNTLNNFLKNLRTQNIHGIYSLVTNSGSYSGHADLLTYGECLGGYALPENINAIEKIEIWQLQ